MLTVIYQVCMCCFFLFLPLHVPPSIDLFSLLSLTAAHQVRQHNLLQSCTHHAFNQSFCCPAPNMCDVFPSAESWIKIKLNLQAPSNPHPSYAFCAFRLKRVVYVFVSGINDAVGLVFFFFKFPPGSEGGSSDDPGLPRVFPKPLPPDSYTAPCAWLWWHQCEQWGHQGKRSWCAVTGIRTLHIKADVVLIRINQSSAV